MPATSGASAGSASSKVKERKLDEEGAGNNMAEALEQIEAVQNEIDDLNEKASDEILTVEQKYNKLRRPHFLKRNEITVTIPNFWAQAIMNHPMLSSLVDKEEEECLKSLTKVDVEEFVDIKSGYKLTFTFKENEFFTNTELVKEFNLSTTGESESKSTKIKWKEGKDFLQKSGGKKSKGTDARKRSIVQYGFFDWFSEDSDPNNDEYAELIKDDIWPNPLHYYLATDEDYSEDKTGLTDGLSDEEDEESLGEEDSDLEDDAEGADDDEDPEEEDPDDDE